MPDPTDNLEFLSVVHGIQARVDAVQKQMGTVVEALATVPETEPMQVMLTEAASLLRIQAQLVANFVEHLAQIDEGLEHIEQKLTNRS